MTIEEISNLLKKIRKERKLTQSQLADMTGFKQSHIARVERGQASMASLQKIAHALGLTVEVNVVVR